jgi:hypothetical protein
MPGFEYFCGANVIVEIEGMPILECAGLSYQIRENKIPLYGYSSRHFDAVARGQVIVQGSMLINFVHHDYLYEAISLASRTQGGLTSPPLVAPSSEASAVLNNPDLRDNLVNSLFKDGNIFNSDSAIQELEDAYYPKVTSPRLLPTISESPSPHDSFGGLDIRVTFGERNEANALSGVTGYVLKQVYFLGRGMPIQIDEEVIVEEYSFFARNVYGLRKGYGIAPQSTGDNNDPEEGAETVAVVTEDGSFITVPAK